MGLGIGTAVASAVLARAIAKPVGDTADPAWVAKVEHLSALCDAGPSKTHIAFLGTAMLARATDRRADVFAIKPEHAPGNPNAFSARSLCHSTLVPLAAEHGISIGVTGREPLNNQPYFRMTRLDDGTPVHAGAKAAFEYMVGLVRELQAMPDEASAFAALHAFVVVRRRQRMSYAPERTAVQIGPQELVEVIRTLVIEDSEDGRRAQAAVAGLMDVVAGTSRVESGRINDPSRKYPGDVCIRSATNATIWEKAIEVRDKTISATDVRIFGMKCLAMGVREAAVVVVAEGQRPLDDAELGVWAHNLGLGLTVFVGWEAFVHQALFWAPEPKPAAAALAVTMIHRRLVAVEASPKAIDLWLRLVSP